MKTRLIFKLCGILFTLLSFANISFGQSKGDVYVNSYYKKDGTFVQGHYRTSPNNDFYDNYSTKGNINPYTLRPGWKTEKDILPSYSTTYVQNRKAIIEKSLNSIEKNVIENDFNGFKKNINTFFSSSEDKVLWTGIFYFYNKQYDLALIEYGLLKSIATEDYYLNEASYLIEVINSILDNISWNEIKGKGLDTVAFDKRYPKEGFLEIEEKLKSISDKRNLFFKYSSLFLLQKSNYAYGAARNALINANKLSAKPILLLEDYDYIIPLAKAFDEAKKTSYTGLTMNDCIGFHNSLLYNQSFINMDSIFNSHFFRKISSNKNVIVYIQEFADMTSLKSLPSIGIIQHISPFYDTFSVFKTYVSFDDDKLFEDCIEVLKYNAGYIKDGSSFLNKNEDAQIDVRREYFIEGLPNVVIAENSFGDKQGFILYSIANKEFIKKLYNKPSH